MFIYLRVLRCLSSGAVYDKGNLMREAESLLIAAQNYALRTNYVKARIKKT